MSWIPLPEEKEGSGAPADFKPRPAKLGEGRREDFILGGNLISR